MKKLSFILVYALTISGVSVMASSDETSNQSLSCNGEGLALLVTKSTSSVSKLVSVTLKTDKNTDYVLSLDGDNDADKGTVSLDAKEVDYSLSTLRVSADRDSAYLGKMTLRLVKKGKAQEIGEAVAFTARLKLDVKAAGQYASDDTVDEKKDLDVECLYVNQIQQ